MALLSADQVEAIHEASMHILENFGIELMSKQALALFERRAPRSTMPRRRCGSIAGWSMRR